MFETIKALIKIILSHSVVNQKLTYFFESINQLESKEYFKCGGYLIGSIAGLANFIGV